jgi:four helix bundle protein
MLSSAMQFAHERLDVYRCSTEHFTLALRAIDGFPRGFAFLSDQLRRAALSIPLNIAEGAGKATDEDKRRFFSTARGSAMECAAIIDAAKSLGIVEEGKAEEQKKLLERIVMMLTKMGAGR